MDNKLGYRLMEALNEDIRSKVDSQYKPLQISLFINGKFAVKGYAQEIIEYLSNEYATFMWFDKAIKQTHAYFNLISWNIDMEENL